MTEPATLNVMKLYKTFIEKLEKYTEDGLVVKRKHPELPIYVLNYTQKCQFDWLFDEITTKTRGLVVTEDYEIVAQCLPKFFSFEQLGKLPEGKYIVEEKMDGSYLSVFNYKGRVVTATRGSFESEMAVDSTRFLNDKVKHYVKDGYTLVCEYVAASNRIVCQYDYEGLVLLTIINPLGQEFDPNTVDVAAEELGWKRPKIYSFESLEEILSYDAPNEEGFVLRYKDNTRVKIKTELYRKLHRLITGLNEKDIWESLKSGTFHTVLEEIPDEMHSWVKEVQADLEEKFNEIKQDVMVNMKDFGDRKTNALYYATCKYPSVMFYLLDGKPINEMVWRMCKPKVTQTFKIISEEAN